MCTLRFVQKTYNAKSNIQPVYIPQRKKPSFLKCKWQKKLYSSILYSTYFWWWCGRKHLLDLIAEILPCVNLQLFPCDCRLDLLVLCPQKLNLFYLKRFIIYFYVTTFFYIFFTKHENVLRFLSFNFTSSLFSSD